MSEKLLIVEDDKNLGYILKEYLEMNGFNTDIAQNGDEGLSKMQQEDYDLCILDIMMPKKDGFTVAKELKNMKKNIPFVFLTAKTLKVDQLKGFNLGADDYIVKPVDEELLIARIRAILKRGEEKTESRYYSIGKYKFIPNKRELTYKDDTQILTSREADVLKLLCQNMEEVLTREDALNKIWGDSNDINRRIMDVYISKLRKYLSNDPNVEIKNIHGTGFILSS
ncbi:MAG: response regulator transcription factor [Balneolaceae bacterium]|nr:response regulator transcription factor [Balneolaceae bacterium]